MEFNSICAECVADLYECWWITNECLVERLHEASLTSQWSGSLASWPHRLACWVLDGLQISLIGLCSLTPFFFHSHDLDPHWWCKRSLVCGWLRFKLGSQGTELWTRPELRGTLAECPRYSSQTTRQTHTQTHTCSHMRRKSNTMSVLHKAPTLSVTHLKSCAQAKFHWYSAQKSHDCEHKHALTFLTFCTSESL